FVYFLDTQRPESQIIWARLRNNEVHKLFHPFDSSVSVGALAAAPKDNLVAMRFGAVPSITPPAVTALKAGIEPARLTPLVPDDEARAAWLTTILDTMRPIARDALPKATLKGRVVERATLLPVPGEVATNDLALIRMRTLARIGRPLCDRP